MSELHKRSNYVMSLQQGIHGNQTPFRYRNAASGSRLKVPPSTHRHTAHVIHKTGSTQHIATPPEEDRITATEDLQTKFCEDRSSGFRDMLADRQTDRQTQTHRQTDKLIAISRSLPRRSKKSV